MRCTAYDVSPITRRSRTPEGYLLVPAMVAASDNVQPYLASELGIKDAAPTKLIRVFRPKAVVDAAAPLFNGVPITLDHPSKMVDTKIYRTVNRGRAMNVVAKDAGLEADLLVQKLKALGEPAEQPVRAEAEPGWRRSGHAGRGSLRGSTLLCHGSRVAPRMRLSSSSSGWMVANAACNC